MAYATIYHLVYHNSARPTYGPSTVPNASAAVMALDEASSELDFTLTAAGYDSPLLASAPSSVKTFFQKAAAYGALAMIESSAQVSHNETDYASYFSRALKTIKSGELPGLEKNAEQSLPRYDHTAATAIFTRDSQF